MTNLKAEREAIVEAIKDYDENVGWVCYPDDVATALLSYEEKVVARVLTQIARIPKMEFKMSDVQEALTLPITDEVN